MAQYEVEIGGTKYEADASSPQEAVSAIKQVHMRSAAEKGVTQATQAAVARGNEPAAHLPLSTLLKPEFMGEKLPGDPGGPPIRPEIGLAYAGAAGMAPAALAAPVATGVSVGTGVLGKVVGGKFGRWAAPELGLDPETSAQLFGVAGSLVGVLSPMTLVNFVKAGGDPKALLQLFNKMITKSPQAIPGAASAPVTAAANAPAAAAPVIAPAVTQAAPAVASAAPAVAEAALPTTLSQKQLELVGQLRGLAQNNPANKIKIAQAAQEMFPNSWQEVLKFIMAPRTTMPTIHMP